MFSSRWSFVVRFGLWSTALTMVSSARTANVIGTTSIAPLGLCVASRATRATLTDSSRLRLFRQPEHALTHDVALDLRGAAPDGLGSGEEERRLQDRHRVIGAAVTPPVTGDELLLLARRAGEDLSVGTEDVHRQVHRVAVRLRPEHLVRGAERGHTEVFLLVDCGRQRAVTVDPHDLDLRPLLREVLTDGRIVDRAVLASLVDDDVELLLEAPVARGRRRAPLETERGHRHLPPVVEAADHV